jgi:hypothetical protein
MAELSLQQFLHAEVDAEGARYRVLQGLQEMQQALRHNIIYPHLGDLIHLHHTLRTVLQQFEQMRQALPGILREIDTEAQRLVYDRPAFVPMGMVEELIQWSMPQIEETIEEGRTVFEFVDGQLHLEGVGLVPAYQNEGYLMVADTGRKQLHVFRYHLSSLMQADERYRSLRTALVQSLSQPTIRLSPQEVKLHLVAERRDLPNPATWIVETEVDFPFESTVLPVAKRKLMRHLCGPTGRA